MPLPPTRSQPLPHLLRTVEWDGMHCAGLVLLGGIAFGAGLIRLLVGPLHQSSNFSLNVLAQAVLQLLGPLLVALLALTRLMPHWLERSRRPGAWAWWHSVLSAGIVGALLFNLFLVVVLLTGMLVTPRADLLGEWRDLLGTIPVATLLEAMGRSGIFLGSCAALGIAEGRRAQRRGALSSEVTADAILHAMALVLVLKLLWILVLSPSPFGGG